MNVSHFIYCKKPISLREAEVLLLCAEGLTMQQTAEKLCITVNTVKSHHRNLSEKFELSGYHAFHTMALLLKDNLTNWLAERK
jgi:DNA-binding CsgD family transcriptional regulator